MTKKQNVIDEMDELKARRKEWICRILLTLHFGTVIVGYIAFLHTEAQLEGPVAPKSTAYEEDHSYVIASIVTASMFLLSLWFYFMKKKTVVIVLSILAIVVMQVILY